MTEHHLHLSQLIAVNADLGPADKAIVQQTLMAVGGMPGLISAGIESLDGLSPRAKRRIHALIRLVPLALKGQSPLKKPIVESQGALAYLGEAIQLERQEAVWVISLDCRHRPIGKRLVAIGALNQCGLYTREVFAPAIRARASSIIVVHNHPSGDASPSEADLQITRELIRAGELLGIPLVDHIVVGLGEHQSILREAKAGLGPAQSRARAQGLDGEHACI